jgi:hypothetical protein
MSTSLTALIDYPDGSDYVRQALLRAFHTVLPDCAVSTSATKCSKPSIQFSDYDLLDFDLLFNDPSKHVANAYVIRKVRQQLLGLPMLTLRARL